MRKEVARPKEAVTQIKQGKLDMKDIFVILGSTAIGYGVRSVNRTRKKSTDEG
ncbi:hypothetical protein [Tetragenococcus halophilus]|uniref:Uncharacterized protein n=1 Tax=Tetragenococcus halophilus TaxID=51669 RepID=A0AB37D6I8_TETHA|nr:hypothetical protein [Tetragenococcus halophilus]QGP77199.1 hypothetical protein GLW17_10605 [Tetragenococcus halophilus]